MAKKIVRLTESELKKLIKRVIKEQSTGSNCNVGDKLFVTNGVTNYVIKVKSVQGNECVGDIIRKFNGKIPKPFLRDDIRFTTVPNSNKIKMTDENGKSTTYTIKNVQSFKNLG